MSAKTAPRFSWSQLPQLPEALGLGGAFAGISRGCFLLAGGTNFPAGPPWQGGQKAWHDAIYLLPADSAHWQFAGRLPRPLAYGVSVTTDHGVLCIGGSDASRHHAEVHLLELRNRTFVLRSLPPLPHPLAYACGALLDQVLYVAGGLEAPDSTSALRRFYSLDLRANHPQWVALEPWPGPGRMLCVAAVQTGSFFLFSGVSLTADANGKTLRSYLRDSYRFSPGAGWSSVAPVPRPVVAAPSPAPPFARSKILVLGADDGSTAGFEPPQAHPGFSKAMFVYDTTDNSWTAAPMAPMACAATPIVPWNQSFVIPSGELRPGVRSPQVWAVAPEV